MLERNKGFDIATKIGGIETVQAANELFQKRMDSEHLGRLEKIKNREDLRLHRLERGRGLHPPAGARPG